MERIGQGVTRTVYGTRRFAFKVPRLRDGWRDWPLNVVRGILANESEWHNRHRRDVATPCVSLFHIVLVMPRADSVGNWDPEDAESAPIFQLGYDHEELKGDSWGCFDGVWLLIDFDESHREPRSLLGHWYWGRQERMAREWIGLASPANPSTTEDPP